MPRGVHGAARGVLLVVAVVGRLFCVVVLMRSRHATFYQASKNDLLLLLLLLSVGRATRLLRFQLVTVSYIYLPPLHTHTPFAAGGGRSDHSRKPKGEVKSTST